MSYKSVVFDLDGTLLNSLEDIANGVNAVFKEHGYSPVKIEEIRQFVGDGAFNLIKRALNSTDVTLPDGKTAALKDEYIDRYTQFQNLQSQPYKGVISLLNNLQQSGIPIGIITNKPQHLLEKIVDQFFSDIRFLMLIGHNEFHALKPDPASAFEFSRRCGYSCENIILVGDSCVDIETAVRANMFPVGVAWGFQDCELLIKAGARKVLSDPLELCELMEL